MTIADEHLAVNIPGGNQDQPLANRRTGQHRERQEAKVQQPHVLRDIAPQEDEPWTGSRVAHQELSPDHEVKQRQHGQPAADEGQSRQRANQQPPTTAGSHVQGIDDGIQDTANTEEPHCGPQW